MKCVDCPRLLPEGSHRNRKRCSACRDLSLKCPKTTMTPHQVVRARALIGKMPRDDIARTLGVSVSSLKRAFRGTRICYFNKYVANPELVEAVGKYYEKHGRNATQLKFPQVKVRSVVERYKKYKPRQTRWSSEQILEAARMAGVVSLRRQAEIFNRPNAHAGSIKSLWMKRFRTGGGNVNGASWSLARHFVKPRCPVVTTEYWATRRKTAAGEIEHSRRIVLWSDFHKNLRSDAPNWVREASATLARFQVWLHGTKRVHSRVTEMLHE